MLSAVVESGERETSRLHTSLPRPTGSRIIALATGFMTLHQTSGDQSEQTSCALCALASTVGTMSQANQSRQTTNKGGLCETVASGERCNSCPRVRDSMTLRFVLAALMTTPSTSSSNSSASQLATVLTSPQGTRSWCNRVDKSLLRYYAFFKGENSSTTAGSFRWLRTQQTYRVELSKYRPLLATNVRSIHEYTQLFHCSRPSQGCVLSMVQPTTTGR